MARTSVWELTLAELVRERGDALYRYALLLCGDPEDAADLVQDALAHTFGRLRNGFSVVSAEAYVRRSILNANLDRGRRAARWRKIAPLEYRPDEVEAPSAATDQRLDLHDELNKLSPRERACVVMRYYEDLKVDDIAARLGISTGAVKRYLSDGLARMALALASDHAPVVQIDDTEAIRQARGRRGPRAVVAGTVGGLAAIALIVPLAVAALPGTVTLKDAAGGSTAENAGEAGAPGAEGADAAFVTYPLQLVFTDDGDEILYVGQSDKLTASQGVSQPLTLTLKNRSDVDQTVCVAPWQMVITRSGEEVWRRDRNDDTRQGAATPEVIPAGEGRSVDFWDLPALAAGDYWVTAAISASCSDGDSDEGADFDLYGTGPVPVRVR